jgi:hypothetical protein
MSIQEDSRGFKKIQLEPEPLITERMGLAAKNDFCRPQGRNLTVTSTDSTCQWAGKQDDPPVCEANNSK